MEGSSSRRLFLPWIRNLLDTGRIPGLRWLDRGQQIFRIPWYRAGKQHNKGNNNACVFREWEIHQGRYKEGQEEQFSQWKCNIRNTLNKYATHMPDKSDEKRRTDPFRVYKFNPSDTDEESQSDFDIKGDLSPEEESRSSDISDSSFHASCMEDDSYDITEIENHNANVLPNIDFDAIQDRVSMETDSFEGYSCLEENASSSFQAIKGEVKDVMLSGHLHRYDTSDELNKDGIMHIIFQYVSSLPNLMNFKTSCRLKYNRLSTNSEVERDENIWPLPNPDKTKYTIENLQKLQSLLDSNIKGVLIECDLGNNIYLTRDCRTKVYVEPPNCEDDSKERLLELQKHTRTKVFDFQKDFEIPLEYYKNGLGPVPDIKVCCSFGQKWKKGDGWKDLILSFSIESACSRAILNQMQVPKAFQEPVDVSMPTTMDVLQDILEMEENTS